MKKAANPEEDDPSPTFGIKTPASSSSPCSIPNSGQMVDANREEIYSEIFQVSLLSALQNKQNIWHPVLLNVSDNINCVAFLMGRKLQQLSLSLLRDHPIHNKHRTAE